MTLKLRVKHEEYPYQEIDDFCNKILNVTEELEIPRRLKKDPLNPTLNRITDNLKRYSDVKHRMNDQMETDLKYPSNRSHHHTVFWALSVILEHLLALMILVCHFSHMLKDKETTS